MTNEAKQLLLTALVSIRDSGPSSLKDGICRNTISIVEKLAPLSLRANAIGLLSSMMERWPDNAVTKYHWASDMYPVEGGATEYMRDACDLKLWKNPRRRELLNWLIQELENELAGSTENNPG